MNLKSDCYWLIPIVFSIIISIPNSEAYSDDQVPVYDYDTNGNLRGSSIIVSNNPIPPYLSSSDDKIDSNDKFSIYSNEEKTKENIEKYYRHVLDETYSDRFIDTMSKYGYETAWFGHFNIDNPKPLSFSLLLPDVILPFKRGLSDVYLIDYDNKIWIDKDGIQYEKNSYNYFNRLTPIQVIKTCNDTPIVITRNHCDFDSIKQYEKKRAESYLKSNHSKLQIQSFAEIDNIFAYEFPKIDHRTQFLIDNNLLEFARNQ